MDATCSACMPARIHQSTLARAAISYFLGLSCRLPLFFLRTFLTLLLPPDAGLIRLFIALDTCETLRTSNLLLLPLLVFIALRCFNTGTLLSGKFSLSVAPLSSFSLAIGSLTIGSLTPWVSSDNCW